MELNSECINLLHIVGIFSTEANKRHILGVSSIVLPVASLILLATACHIGFRNVQLQNLCTNVPCSEHPLKQLGDAVG